MTRSSPEPGRVLAGLHRAAQENLGLLAASTAMSQWDSVNPVAPLKSRRWLRELLAQLLGLRKVSRRLAATYYRAHRVLETGSLTPTFEGDRHPEVASARDALDAFRAELQGLARLGRPLSATRESLPVPPQSESFAEPGADQILSALDALASRFGVAVSTVDESFKWQLGNDAGFDVDFLELIAKNLGQLRDELADLDEFVSQDRDELLKAIDERASAAGHRIASVADTSAIQPGRDVVQATGSRDRLNMGWMRATGPHPCAFCSMLASRGAVYSSRSTALLTLKSGKRTAKQKSAKGRENNGSDATALPGLTYYHPNCHCHAVPVFTSEPSYSARDKFFMDAWKKHAGKEPDPLNAWRRWLAQAYKEGLVPDQDVVGPATAS